MLCCCVVRRNKESTKQKQHEQHKPNKKAHTQNIQRHDNTNTHIDNQQHTKKKSTNKQTTHTTHYLVCPQRKETKGKHKHTNKNNINKTSQDAQA